MSKLPPVISDADFLADEVSQSGRLPVFNCLLAITAAFLFFCGVRAEEEERGPAGGPRLHPDRSSPGPRRAVGDGADRKHQSADRCAGEPVGQPRACACAGAPEGDLPPDHRQGELERTCQLCRVATPPSGAHFSVQQVESNHPEAVYTLMQKERELNFPFQITADGEIQLTEELDREDKDMVRGRLEQDKKLCWMNGKQTKHVCVNFLPVHPCGEGNGSPWQHCGSTHGDYHLCRGRER